MSSIYGQDDCRRRRRSTLSAVYTRPASVRTSRANRLHPDFLPTLQAFFQRLREIFLDDLGRHFSMAQEIRPQKFAEWRRVLGETAGPAQFAREAAEGIVLEIGDRFRQRSPKCRRSPTPWRRRDRPHRLLSITPQNASLSTHGEIADHRHENIARRPRREAHAPDDGDRPRSIVSPVRRTTGIMWLVRAIPPSFSAPPGRAMRYVAFPSLPESPPSSGSDGARELEFWVDHRFAEVRHDWKSPVGFSQICRCCSFDYGMMSPAINHLFGHTQSGYGGAAWASIASYRTHQKRPVHDEQPEGPDIKAINRPAWRPRDRHRRASGSISGPISVIAV